MAWVNYAKGMIGWEMHTHTEKAAHYRVRAGEMRELAARTTSQNFREIFLKTAGDYELLAGIQDQLAADDPRSL